MTRKRFILWVDLEQFYIRDKDSELPQIVFRDDIVLDLDTRARERNLYRGMPLRQAKAILTEGVFLKWEAEAFVRDSVRWLDECIAVSNAIEPADQHSAWIDLSDHPDPLSIAEELIKTLAHTTGLKVRWGYGPSKWLAQLTARHHKTSTLESQRDFLSQLPTQELLPVELEQRNRLMFLGYSTIGQVATLPFSALQEQFDEDAYKIAAAAIGEWSDDVHPLYPPQSCMDRFIFEGSAESTEIIQNGLSFLAERLSQTLDLQSLEGNRMVITLEFAEGGSKQFERTFSKPFYDHDSILASINLLVEKEFRRPLAAVHVLLAELRKVHSVQAIFLSRDPARVPKRLESTLRRVRAVFGDHSVLLGRDIRLPRRVRVLRAWKHATGWQ